MSNINHSETNTVQVLNQQEDDLVCAIFHNKAQNSLVVVSKRDSEWSVLCYSFSKLQEAQNYPPDQLFDDLSVRFWPTSIQFDELNGKMITHHQVRQEMACVVYNLDDYKPSFCLTNINTKNVQIR